MLIPYIKKMKKTCNKAKVSHIHCHGEKGKTPVARHQKVTVNVVENTHPLTMFASVMMTLSDAPDVRHD